MILMETKIPPPFVALIFILLMWIVSLALPTVGVRDALGGGIRVAGLALFGGIGVLLLVLAVRQFGAVNTTTDPLQPHKASTLVTGGIFRISRNPIYLGFLCILIGWGVFLANIFSLACCALFVLYLTRFQIKPEERALESMFGQQYIVYKRQTRRWL